MSEYREQIRVEASIRLAKKPSNVSETEMHDLKKEYPGNPDAQYGTAWKISQNRKKKHKKK